MTKISELEVRVQKNNEYYEAFASKVQERTENRDFSKAFNEFLPKVEPDQIILDIGCGAGNHLKVFKEKGFKCLGVEPSSEMRKLASAFAPVIEGTFESLGKLNLPKVGGIWCASSLLHVPSGEVAAVMHSISGLLHEGAPLYFTVRLGEGFKWDKWDDAEGSASRFIQLFTREELLKVLSDSGFNEINEWVEDSYWGRPSKWISVVAVRG